MGTDLHDDDPKAIWQNQPMEVARVNSVLIRQKIRQLQARARRESLTSLVVPAIVVAFYVFCVMNFPQLREVLSALFAFVFAWSLGGVYFLNRGKRSRGMPENAGFTTGLNFCRQEIERQRDYSRRVLLWSFGPLVVAIAALILAFAAIAGKEFFPKAMPVTVLAILWIAAYLVVRVRQQHQLQRESDELRAVETENSREN